MVHLAAASMAIADFPLLIQDVLRYNFEKLLLGKHKKPLTIDMAIEMTAMVCDRAHNKVFILFHNQRLHSAEKKYKQDHVSISRN